jgi:hypothetical protein
LPKLTYVHRSGKRVDVVVSVFQANPGWLVERVAACAWLDARAMGVPPTAGSGMIPSA